MRRTWIMVLLVAAALASTLVLAVVQAQRADLPAGLERNLFRVPCPDPKDADGNPIPKTEDGNGDWDKNTDDVGEDGVAGTNDAGEGDGKSGPGEPNIDWLVHEKDFPNATVRVWCIDGQFTFFAVTIGTPKGGDPTEVRFGGGCTNWDNGLNGLWKQKDAGGNLTHTYWLTVDPDTEKAKIYTYDLATKNVTRQKYTGTDTTGSGGTKDGAPQSSAAPGGGPTPKFKHTDVSFSPTDTFPNAGSCGLPLSDVSFGVGGTAEPLFGGSDAPSEDGSAASSGGSMLTIAAAAGGVLIALAGGGLYLRRRLVR